MLQNFPLLDSKEKSNVVTHALGIPGSLIAFISILFFNNPTIGKLIFVLAMLGMFSASTIYHLQVDKRKQQQWKRLDHISIFVLIAGTYTPFLLTFIKNQTGSILIIVLWMCALTGGILKLFYAGKYKAFSTLLYLIMGWSALFAITDFIKLIPLTILIWIGIGGIFYSLGAVFYQWSFWKYNHALWHVFVVLGAASHYIAVALI